MPSAKPPSRVVPATGRPVLIVAHGAPWVPCAQEAALAGLADAVGRLLPDRLVRSATLACPGALEDAVQDLVDPIVFPLFMTDGFFVSTLLPRRLTSAGLAHWDVLTPLGLDPSLPEIALSHLRAELVVRDLSGPAATLVLAAHGSPSNPKPAQATYAFARKLEESRLFGALQVGFVDEKPSLEEAATVTGPALLLPFFATRAGHVVIDLREAVAAAGFKGTVLPPIGVWPEVRDLVAQAVLRYDLALVV